MDEAEQIRAALTREGWSVTDLRENVVEVEGKVLDVTVGAASKALFRGRFVRIGACVDGDLVDRTFASRSATRRVGGTKFRADVLDTGRALALLAELEALPRAPDFGAALSLVEARGFTVDRSASVEHLEDAFTWTIRARTSSEAIDVHVRFGDPGPSERGSTAFVNSFDQAERRGASDLVTVTVHAPAIAEELLDALALPPVG